jgi:hypothetical protein
MIPIVMAPDSPSMEAIIATKSRTSSPTTGPTHLECLQRCCGCDVYYGMIDYVLDGMPTRVPPKDPDSTSDLKWLKLFLTRNLGWLGHCNMEILHRRVQLIGQVRQDTIGREVETLLDSNQYLCFSGKSKRCFFCF